MSFLQPFVFDSFIISKGGILSWKINHLINSKESFCIPDNQIQKSWSLEAQKCMYVESFFFFERWCVLSESLLLGCCCQDHGFIFYCSETHISCHATFSNYYLTIYPCLVLTKKAHLQSKEEKIPRSLLNSKWTTYNWPNEMYNMNSSYHVSH